MPTLDAPWVRFGAVDDLTVADRRQRGKVVRHAPVAGDDDLVAYLGGADSSYNVVSLTSIDSIWNAVWSGAKAYEKAGAGVNTLQEGGTPYASMVDSAARLNAGVARAKALGVTFIARGRFRVDSTVTIDCDADLSGAEFISGDNNINAVVLIGTRTSGAKVGRIEVIAPKVHNSAKNPQNSGGWVGTSIGIEIANLTRSEVWIPLASRYTTGVAVRGIGTGCADNTIHIDHADNNKVSLHCWAEASGWVNANHFSGGKLGLQGTEGTLVVGVRQILLGHASFPNEAAPNGNTFTINLEGDVAEYTVESIGGVYNRFIGCRWESTSNARIFWNEATATRFSRDNTVEGGYNGEFIVHTFSANSNKYKFETVSRNYIEGSVAAPAALYQMRNRNSAQGGVFQLFDTTVNPALSTGSDWTWEWASAHLKAKRVADTVERLKIDQNNGRIQLGPGGVGALDIDIQRLAANVAGTGVGDKWVANGGLGVGNSAAAAVGVGALVNKMEVFDAAGVSLGFVPIYATIT